MAKSKSDISLNDLKAMLPQEGSIAEQEAALRALTTLSQEDRNLLAAVQESPYRLTTLEQFREFPANTEYFILESRVNKLDTLGWRYLFEHTDIVSRMSCWTPLIPFLSATTPCGRNRGASPVKGISPFPATSGSMSVPGRGRRRKSPPSRSGWSRAGRNVPTRARRSPIGKSLRRNCKEVSLCPIMTMTKIILCRFHHQPGQV